MKRGFFSSIAVALANTVVCLGVATGSAHAGSFVTLHRITNSIFTNICFETATCPPDDFNGFASPTTTFTGTSSASWATGHVTGYSRVDVANPTTSFGDGIQARSVADVEDFYNSAVFANLTITMALAGSTTGAFDPLGHRPVVGQLSGLGEDIPDGTVCYLFNPGESCSVTVPVGPALNGGARLILETLIQVGPSLTGGPDFTLIVDFSNSLEITGFAAADLDGNPISLDLIESSSGLALTSTGYAAVPEPASALLAGVGAGLTMLLSRIRRSR